MKQPAARMLVLAAGCFWGLGDAVGGSGLNLIGAYAGEISRQPDAKGSRQGFEASGGSVKKIIAIGLAVGFAGCGLIAQRRMPPVWVAPPGIWRAWLGEDVRYIITDEERQVFKKLKTDDERRLFVEQFWSRRDRTPDTQENEVKEEHYRRIAYADGRYSTMVAGSKTDRGMIYIKYGPPDEIEAHPAGGTYKRPPEEGGGDTSTFPFEKWRYSVVEGVGTGLEIEFVDTMKTGDYHIALDPEEKDNILYVPGTPSPKLMRPPIKGEGLNGKHMGPKQPPEIFEVIRLEPIPTTKPPAVKYKDLAAVLNTDVRYNTLPMQVRADYIRMTHATIAADLMVQFRNADLQYVTDGKIAKAGVRIFGRISDLKGYTVDWFEDTVTQEIPSDTLELIKSQPQIYSKRLLLAPGVYQLSLAAQDSAGHTMNTFEMPLNVPSYDAATLGVSSVILAEQLEHVAADVIGRGEFVIRSARVRPRMNAVFKQSETMGIYMEFYNFSFDPTTRKWNGTVEYQIVNDADENVVVTYTEDLSDPKAFPLASPFLVTVEKKYPLRALAPGRYTLKMKVQDRASNQTLTPSAKFTVASS